MPTCRAILGPLFTILTIAAGLFQALPAIAASSSADSVQQLIAWELGSNVTLDRGFLEHAAAGVLPLVDQESLPKSAQVEIKNIRNKQFEYGMRDGDFRKIELGMQKLSDATLLAIAQNSFAVEYADIPMDLIEEPLSLFVEELNGDRSATIRKYFIFKKGSREYLRWYIHPLNIGDIRSPFHNFLERKRREGIAIPIQSGEVFAHLTSSRSMILFKKSDYSDAISLKVSLPSGGPVFGDKTIKNDVYQAWINNSRYFFGAATGVKFKRLKMMNETLGLSLETNSSFIDGMVIRDLRTVTKDNMILLPAFAALHEETGRMIAARNGSKKPLEFWHANFLLPFAEAMAELRAYTGMEHTSPHSQNVLIELDQELRPTGKIVMRDMDFYVDSEALDVLASKAEVKFTEDGYRRIESRRDYKYHGFSLQNGLKRLPGWMSQENYGRWVMDYFNRFKEHLSDLTGIEENRAFDGVYAKRPSGVKVPVPQYSFNKGPNGNFHALMFNDDIFNDQYEEWLAKRGAKKNRSVRRKSKDKSDCAGLFRPAGSAATLTW